MQSSPSPPETSTPDLPSPSLESAVVEFFHSCLTQVPGFQPRQPQLEMAIAVARAIEQEQRVAIEAGTGTGKSVAYLVPLLLRAQSSEAPAIIATKTVQLQEQLLKKDLPALLSLLQSPRKVVLAKGWSNYVCLRRVEQPDEKSLAQLGPALGTLRQSLIQNGGRLTRQEAPVTSAQWNVVKADPADCQKRLCPHFSSCGLFAERRELESAELIVTNHAFLLTDLRLKREGRGLLPDAEILVVDEAHRLDDVATEHLAVRLDADRVYSTISAPLLSGNEGWLAAARFTFLMTLPEIDFLPWSERFDRVILLGLRTLEDLSEALLRELQVLFSIRDQRRLDLATTLHSELGEGLANLLSELGLSLDEISSDMARLCRDYEQAFDLSAPPELVRLAQSLSRLAQDVEFLSAAESQEWVYLAEPEGIVARPVDNAEVLERELFDEFKATIVTSASLLVSGELDFFRRRVGLGDRVEELALPSPFEIVTSTFVGLVDVGPDPNSPDYVPEVVESLVPLVGQLEGRTLMLATSHRTVAEFARLLREPLRESGVTLLVQGEESPGRLLQRFTQPGRHLLLGVDTFWEGVDIPGERLSCVVMTRLPFPVPTDVLFKARSQRIDQAGGNSFRELSLPLVQLKLKQGFGRLLRTENDRGLFLLTDPRACQRQYGKRLFETLPFEHAVRADWPEVTRQARQWCQDYLPKQPEQW